jgi:long-chain acyl-CoA synthetase
MSDTAGARGTAISERAAGAPERLALLCEGLGCRTFAQLDAAANRLARAFRRRGLGAGDAVALLCTNRPEFAETWAAARRAGLRLTAINTHLQADEASYVVDDCDARALVVDAAVGPVAARVAGRGRPAVRLAVGGPLDGCQSYAEALAAEAPDALADPAVGSTMLYTSGTTGRPKGVFRAEAPETRERNRYRPETDRQLVTGPLYHAAPLKQLGDALEAGVGAVVMSRFDPLEALRLIEAHRVTHTHLVPTMFHRLLALPEAERRRHDLSSLRAVVHGAAPCPLHVKRAMIEWLGPIVYEYYSATEGGGTWVSSKTWLERPGTVGRAVEPDGIRIRDEAGDDLGPRREGLVYLRAPRRGRFRYYKDDAKTEAAYRGGGGDYFTLGDVGYLDEDGFLFLTDRSANLIVSGGVNIYPAEVDAVLLEHPAVADAAVIGVPDEEWGETVRGVVEPRPGADAGEALARELIEFCRSRLAHYKCPRVIDFVERLPRSEAGKIHKQGLREAYRRRARAGGG